MELRSEIVGEILIFWLGLLWKSDRAMFYLLFSNRRFSVNFLIQKKPKIDPESHNFLNAARKPLKPDYRIKLYFQVPKHLTAWLSLSEEYHKRFVCYVSSESHEAALYQILCVFF